MKRVVPIGEDIQEIQKWGKLKILEFCHSEMKKDVEDLPSNYFSPEKSIIRYHEIKNSEDSETERYITCILNTEKKLPSSFRLKRISSNDVLRIANACFSGKEFRIAFEKDKKPFIPISGSLEEELLYENQVSNVEEEDEHYNVTYDYDGGGAACFQISKKNPKEKNMAWHEHPQDFGDDDDDILSGEIGEFDEDSFSGDENSLKTGRAKVGRIVEEKKYPIKKVVEIV